MELLVLSVIKLKNSNAELFISKTNGIIQGLCFDGTTALVAGQELFSFGLRDKSGNLHIHYGTGFADFDYRIWRNNCQLCYGGGALPGVEFRMRIESKEKVFLFFPELSGVSDDFILEWIDAPQLFIPKDGKLFWPRTEGILIDDFDLRERTVPYHPLGFAEGSPGGRYPGNCQMQFLAHYHNERGIYFAAHDFDHTPKAVEFAPAGDKMRRLSLQTFCGGAMPYYSRFPYVLSAYSGDWRDACAIYREYVAADPALPPKGFRPDLVKESPVVLIYPVQGRGLDRGAMADNEYFPYIEALPAILNLAGKIDSKVLALLMHWEGTAPWAPPYVWPPLGGEKGLLHYRDELHNNGHYLGVYCSGTAWTQKSSINSYSREAECEKENWYDDMIRGPKGEINAYSCNGETRQRIGFDLCLFRDRSRRTIIEEIEKLAGAGLDYVQFFDQNIGGEFNPCYSREHGHPPAPGLWQTETMKSLLAASAASGVLLGCEAAAADCFISELPLNDLRNNFSWWFGLPVPGYAFVFHEYANNFMGNQCGVGVLFDLLASPENILYRLAYSFNAGDMLSLVLKDHGHIHWGWTLAWDFPEPDQDKIIKLVRNLNRFRRNFMGFMQTGRMERSLLRVSGGRSIRLKMHAGRVCEVPGFFHNSWSDSGRRIEVFTNYLPVTQKLYCTLPQDVVARTGNSPCKENFELSLPPLTAVAVEIYFDPQTKL